MSVVLRVVVCLCACFGGLVFCGVGFVMRLFVVFVVCSFILPFYVHVFVCLFVCFRVCVMLRLFVLMFCFCGMGLCLLVW